MSVLPRDENFVPIQNSGGGSISSTKIQEGEMFMVTGDLSINSSATATFLIVTPVSTDYSHFIGMIGSNEQPGSLKIEEDVTTFSDGVAQTTFNRDRNSSNTTSVNVFAAPSVNDSGTQIYKESFEAGGRIGGTDRGFYELILKANTKYLFTISNSGASAADFNYILNWYEGD